MPGACACRHRDAGSSHLDPRRYRPLLYVFHHYYYGVGPALGRTFKTEV